MLHREIAELIANYEGNPFGGGAAGELGDLAAASGLGSRIEDRCDSPGEFLQLMMQVAAPGIGTQKEGAGQSEGGHEFAATLPWGTIEGIRPTHVVVREILRSAKRSVAILGYELSKGGKIVGQLIDAAARGAEMTIVCDRDSEGPEVVQEGWDDSIQAPELLVNTPLGGSKKMHCKVLCVDGRDLLITSANFTFHGMQGNIEFGVRLRDRESASNARLFVDGLREKGFLVPYEGK
jgi:phosphatidylserine/phosphatidylglycerophosphate/cardiolipin synthase-like enzyme